MSRHGPPRRVRRMHQALHLADTQRRVYVVVQTHLQRGDFVWKSTKANVAAAPTWDRNQPVCEFKVEALEASGTLRCVVPYFFCLSDVFFVRCTSSCLVLVAIRCWLLLAECVIRMACRVFFSSFFFLMCSLRLGIAPHVHMKSRLAPAQACVPLCGPRVFDDVGPTTGVLSKQVIRAYLLPNKHE